MIRAIWQPNLGNAIAYVQFNELSAHFIQFVEDNANSGSYWIILKDIPEAQITTLVRKTPNLTFI